MAITNRKRMFAKAYATNGFQRKEAVEAAGFSMVSWHTTASRMLRDPQVQKLIEHYQGKQLKKFDVSQLDDAYVLGEMVDLLDRIRECGMGSWQATAETKILELLGRYRQLFTERVELGLDEKFVRILEEGRERARQRFLESQPAALPEPAQALLPAATIEGDAGEEAK